MIIIKEEEEEGGTQCSAHLCDGTVTAYISPVNHKNKYVLLRGIAYA